MTQSQPQPDLLPQDLYRFDQSPDAEWRSLEERGAEARAQGIDLVGQLWIEEEAQGKAGWRGRVQMRLGLDDGAESKALNTIGDYARIFRTFRMGGSEGLAWSLDELKRHQPGRLRVFAQNRDWALENPDRVRDMLESGRNEGRLRKEVREARAAAEAGREEVDTEQKAVYKNFVLRVSAEDAALLLTILDGYHAKMESQGAELSDLEAVRHGELVMAMAGDWFNGSSVVLREGKPTLVEHAEWVAQAANERLGAEEPDADAVPF